MRKGMAAGLARPGPIDRNGSTKMFNIGLGAIAPHGTTTRWTYTIGAGKKASIDAIHLHILRDTVAAPAGKVNIILSVTPSGSGATQMYEAEMLTNGVGDTRDIIAAGLGSMQAGDAISTSTNDPSTGGTVSYFLSAKVTEFDA